MIVLTPTTAAALALHAAEGSWVMFSQVIPPTGQGPIKIEGLRGAQLAPRLASIVRDNAFEIQLIGLMASSIPQEHAAAIAEEHHASHLHDNWFEPTGDLLAFIQHAAQDAMRELLAETHPGAVESDQIVGVEDMAQILGVSVPTMRRMIKAEQIPYMRIGKIYRFEPNSVIASLRRGR